MMIADQNNPLANTQAAPVLKTKATRACRICTTELTDSASMNEGIGPICRRKANLALAREIKTNINKMDVIGYFGLSFVLPEEAQATWTEIQETINKISEDTAGLDLRKTVKQIAWVLSFDLPRTTVETLFSLVEALGYEAFANLLRLEGRNGSGAASLTFANGLVTLKAPRNGDGRDAIKAIKGVFFQGAPSNTWNAPARVAADFIKACKRHWPLVTGASESLAQAEAFLQTAAPAQIAATPAAPVIEVKIALQNGIFLITSPFNANFVADLKSLPREARAWTGTAWSVRASYQKEMVGMIARHYPTAKVVGI